jgi:hypothetical protein
VFRRRQKRSCSPGRHELEIDFIRYATVYRCKICFEIPDVQQREMWEFEERTLADLQELPFPRRFAELKSRVDAEMKRRNYVSPVVT